MERWAGRAEPLGGEGLLLDGDVVLDEHVGHVDLDVGQLRVQGEVGVQRRRVELGVEVGLDVELGRRAEGALGDQVEIVQRLAARGYDAVKNSVIRLKKETTDVELGRDVNKQLLLSLLPLLIRVKLSSR